MRYFGSSTRSIRRAGTPNARRGRSAGALTGERRTTRYGVFERAAADFPRSDYRPMWLYWSGRAHEALNQPSLARERYALVASDYLNSYYGRLAVKRPPIPPPPRVFGDDGERGPPPANEPLVRTLLSLARYDEALTSFGTRSGRGATRRRFKRRSPGSTSSRAWRSGYRTVQAAPRVDHDDAARLSPVSGGGRQGLPREVLR